MLKFRCMCRCSLVCVYVFFSLYHVYGVFSTRMVSFTPTPNLLQNSIPTVQAFFFSFSTPLPVPIVLLFLCHSLALPTGLGSSKNGKALRRCILAAPVWFFFLSIITVRAYAQSVCVMKLFLNILFLWQRKKTTETKKWCKKSQLLTVAMVSLVHQEFRIHLYLGMYKCTNVSKEPWYLFFTQYYSEKESEISSVWVFSVARNFRPSFSSFVLHYGLFPSITFLCN